MKAQDLAEELISLDEPELEVEIASDSGHYKIVKVEKGLCGDKPVIYIEVKG